MLMRRISKKIKNSFSGQQMIEYILVLVGVVAVLLVALGPNGFMTEKIDESLDEAVQGTKCFAMAACYDPSGCSATCGNGCCEWSEKTGKKFGGCPADCS